MTPKPRAPGAGVSVWIAALSLVIHLTLAAGAEPCPRSQHPFRLLGSSFLHFPGAPRAPEGFDIADLDGDGIPDAVASFRGDPPVLRAYLAQAPLCFRPVWETAIEAAGPVHIADVTGDGVQDVLLFGGYPRASIQVFAGEDGTAFQLLASSGMGVTDWPSQIIVQDVDGDDSADIVVAGGGGTISYGPLFASFEGLPVGQNAARGALCLDVDADGRDDLLFVVSHGSYDFVLLRQVGKRLFQSFALRGTARGPLARFGSDPEGRAVILAGTPDGLSSFVIVRPEHEWQAVRLDVLDSSGGAASHALGDMDGDGVVDLARVGDDGLAFALFGRIEGGSLRLDGPTEESWLAGVSGWRQPLLCDIDGDGRLDLLRGSPVSGSAFLLLGRDRRFVSGRRIEDGSDRMTGATFDANGDGVADAVVAGGLPGGDAVIFLGGSDGPVRTGTVPIGGRSPVAAGRIHPSWPPLVIAPSGDAILGWEIRPDGTSEDPGTLAVGEGTLSWTSLHGEGTPWGPLLLAIESDPGGLLRIWGLSSQDGLHLSEAARFLVAPNSYRPLAADLERDGFPDLLWSMSRGVGVLRGGPSGFVPYLAAVDLGCDSIAALDAGDVDDDGVAEILAAAVGGGAAGLHLIARDASGDWIPRCLAEDPPKAIAVADLDGDGDTDVMGADGRGLSVFRNEDGALLGPERLRYATSAGAGVCMGVLDLDGDGHRDIVCSDYIRLVVTYGEEDGKLPATLPIGRIGGSGTSVLIPGDFDGDGKADLLAQHQNGADEILLAQAGGVFGEPVALEPPFRSAMQTVVGDFDGDGVLDLVSNTYSYDVLYWGRGKGDGSFHEATRLAATFGFLGLAEDLDADGAADLLLWNHGIPLSVLRGGAGFATAAPEELPVVLVALRAALVDLDGDGRRDLVLSGTDDESSEDVQIVLPGSPDGTLAPPVLLGDPPIFDPARLLGDLDADGLTDVVFEESGELRVGLGVGGFAFAPRPAGGAGTRGLSPRSVVDVDGDGLLDLIAAGSIHSQAILRGLGDGGFAEPTYFPILTDAFVHDADGDGLLDGLLIVSEGNERRIHALLASGDHLLLAPRSYEHLLRGQSLAAGDFDGDGREDLCVVAKDTRTIGFLVGGPGRNAERAAAFTAPGGPSKPDAYWVAAADVDADGMDDVLLLGGGTLWLLRSLGLFEFAEARVLATEVPGRGISAADLDGDGILDVLVEGFSVLRGKGGGSFEDPRSYGRAGEAVSPSAVGDFTGDGVVDAAYWLGAGLVAIAEGTDRASFRTNRYLPLGVSAGVGPAVGDFDGDGLGDVAVGPVASRDPADPPRIWYSRDDGSFRMGPPLIDPIGNDEGVRALAAADLDRDGVDDLLGADDWAYLHVWFGGAEISGGDEISGRPDIVAQAPTDAALLLVADLTGDGVLDVLVGGESGTFFTAGAGGFATGVEFRRGDPNGDGKIEVTDPIVIARWAFFGGPAPACEDAADADDDGTITLADPILILTHVFLGGTPPEPPFGACGPDPTPDALGCEVYASCAR